MVINSFPKLDSALKKSFSQIRKDIVRLNSELKVLKHDSLRKDSFHKKIQELNDIILDLDVDTKFAALRSDITSLRKETDKIKQLSHDVDDLIIDFDSLSANSLTKDAFENGLSSVKKDINRLDADSLKLKKETKCNFDSIIKLKKEISELRSDIDNSASKSDIAAFENRSLKADSSSREKHSEEMRELLSRLDNLELKQESDIKEIKHHVSSDSSSDKNIQHIQQRIDHLDRRINSIGKLELKEDVFYKKIGKPSLKEKLNDMFSEEEEVQIRRPVKKIEPKHLSSEPSTMLGRIKDFFFEEVDIETPDEKTDMPEKINTQKIKKSDNIKRKPEMMIKKDSQEQPKEKKGIFSKVKDFFVEEEFEE